MGNALKHAKRLFLSGLIWASATAGAFALCQPDRLDVRGPWGSAQFRIEIADDAAERAQGLMHRESLPKLSGMLFIYDTPGDLTFWMRNTLIPLDMIFIDPTGRITHIHENAIPHDETGISGGDGNLAVLEINGGLARSLGITVGSEIRHAAFGADGVAWSCAE
jgi:uncharacterized membrane protein (UPF0127 family)